MNEKPDADGRHLQRLRQKRDLGQINCGRIPEPEWIVFERENDR